MRNKKKQVVVFLVEGPTEIEFYKALVKHIHNRMDAQLSCTFEWVNMKGIGNYKNDALRYLKTIKKKHPSDAINVFMCIDTDVFELSKRPPINKAAIKKELMKEGANKVQYIEANKSIEDWFLIDQKGILSFLKLPADTRIPSGTGQEVLKKLYKKANKVYIKGGTTQGFIEKLDIEKIISTNCVNLKPLCQTIGADCKKICNKNTSY